MKKLFMNEAYQTREKPLLADISTETVHFKIKNPRSTRGTIFILISF